MATPERVKVLRQRLISAFETHRKNGTTEAHPHRIPGKIMHDMEVLFLAMQLYSYHGDYLRNGPAVERIAETVDKLEEDLLDRPLPSLRGDRHVTVRFGRPIAIPGDRRARAEVSQLTATVQQAVQSLVDAMRDAPAPPVAPETVRR